MKGYIEAAVVFPKNKYSSLPADLEREARIQLGARLGLKEKVYDYEFTIQGITETKSFWNVQVTLTPRPAVV